MIALNRNLALAALFAAVTACGEPEATAPPPTVPQRTSVYDAAELTEQRVEDLVAIRGALERYKLANGRYPATEDGGFVDVLTSGPLWINGLVPDYLDRLPREPLNSALPDRPQYRYSSDGSDYKLIVHGVSGECDSAVERNGIRMDPMRTRDGRCWAYGFWTEGRRQW